VTKLRTDGLTRILREHPRAGSTELCARLNGINRATAGKVLRELALELTGATVTVLRRIDTRVSSPLPETTLEEGDVLVLLGTGDQLEAAEIRLLRG